MVMHANAPSDGHTCVTYELEEIEDGGWSWVPSDVKPAAETGSLLSPRSGFS